ncbi:unnamed protein product [Blepharisma stoltei]|uniref:Uncharacterized protein n=1 Tax=Blepharisma stoltei TaxID=1481888 RepID=A0AAU9K0M7_9CILI|nr:unnamed protein product [Blepharisma stoltei]
MNPYSVIIDIIEARGNIDLFRDDLTQNIEGLSHKIQIYEAEVSYLHDLDKLTNNVTSTYLPILRSAHEALLSINKYDHFEIYSYQKPPKIMETVMMGIPILLGCKKPSWGQYKIIAQWRNLWNDLLSLEVTPKALENIKPIIEEFEGNEMQLKMCSTALYKWYSWM